MSTEKRRAAERRAFLAEVSDELLESSLDYEERLATVARLAVPRLADWAAIDMLAEGGAIRRLAVAHTDPAKVAWVQEIERRYPSDPTATSGLYAILRTGRSEIVSEISDEMLMAGVRDEEHLRLVRAIGLRSYLGVPLISHGRVLGALTLATAESGRVYGPEDLTFVEAIAVRAAMAIVNAQLHAESESARITAQAAERRFRMLAEAIPQIVWTVDVNGEHEYLSPKWYEYTGQSPEEADEGRWAKAIHPDDFRQCFQLWADAAEAGEAWQMEYRLRRADGVYRWHIGRSVPQFEEGRVVKWYGTATDIEDQKRAVRDRDNLLATVSHDLRNPLGAIVFSVSLLKEAATDLPQIVRTIERSTAQMSALIKDLLDIAAIEAGQLSITRAPHLMSALVAEAVSHQQLHVEQKGVVLLTLPGGEEATVHCDRTRILQVFANLIGNALKFTPPGGAIMVSRDVQGGEARFLITDTGPGIPQPQRERVFDRFWRDQGSRNAGTGLGLAISRGILAQHGGRIWVEGLEGEGATFVFTLPLTSDGALPG